MKWLLVPAGIALAAFGLDRLLLWMEWRGWLDYRRTHPGRIDTVQVGPALLGIQALFQSGAKRNLEETPSARSGRPRETESHDRGRQGLASRRAALAGGRRRRLAA
ncbi:MAG: hypothetical protein ACRD3M_14830 [Thermoanaerobaculia bacterium]